MMKELSRTNSLMKESSFGDFETMDLINEEIILIHHQAFSLDHLACVHIDRPSYILDIIGGYQLLYPVFEKSMRSNLSGFQISDLWKLLFKILRSFMQADPHQILRLFKSNYLVESLKSCIIRGASNDSLLTNDLLQEILNVVRDVHTNKNFEILEEFYKEYMLKILLDDSFCDLTFVDKHKSYRRIRVFEEVVQNIVSLYNEEDSSAPGNYKKAQVARRGEFFTPGTSKEIYSKVFSLIVRYQDPENMKHTKHLAYLLMRILVTHSLTDKFQSLIDGIQQTGIQSKKPNSKISKETLLAKLKILEGVIMDNSFD